MKEVTLKVYSIDELSEEARKIAIEKNRYPIASMLNEFDSNEYEQALQEIERALKIRVYNWSVDAFSHYFCFEITNEWSEHDDEERLFLRWLNNVALPACQKGKYYSKGYLDENGKYRYRQRRSLVLPELYECCLTGTWCDQAVDDMIKKSSELARAGKTTVSGFIKELLNAFFDSWQEDMQNNESDEVIAEELSINNCEFLEDGRAFAL